MKLSPDLKAPHILQDKEVYGLSNVHPKHLQGSVLMLEQVEHCL